MYSAYLPQVMTLDDLIFNHSRLHKEIYSSRFEYNSYEHQLLMERWAMANAELTRRISAMEGFDWGRVMGSLL